MKLFIIFFVSLILIYSIAFMSVSNQIFAQISPTLAISGNGLVLPDVLKNTFNQGKNTSMNLINQATPEALKNTFNQGKNTSMNLINQAAVKKLESISSLTNVVGISMVNGIKLNGIVIGDTDISVTLKYQSAQNNIGNNSLPVTVIITKLPVANLTQLISLVESSKTIAMSSSRSGSIDSLLDQTKLNSVTLNNALQILSLVKNLQTGVASITLSSSMNPQTVSMKMLGASGSSLSTVTNDFVTVVVVPYLGVSSFPSISLK
jgi:hypothetical protein